MSEREPDDPWQPMTMGSVAVSIPSTQKLRYKISPEMGEWPTINAMIGAIRSHAQAISDTMAMPNTRARGQRMAKIVRELNSLADRAEAARPLEEISNG